MTRSSCCSRDQRADLGLGIERRCRRAAPCRTRRRGRRTRRRPAARRRGACRRCRSGRSWRTPPSPAPGTAGVEVGVGEDDVGRLAAELERHALEVAGRGLDDLLAGQVRAGEGDLVDVRMRGQRRAGGLAVAGHDVDHARRHAGFEHSSPSRSEVSGASSAGFSTIVQPVASAGPIFQIVARQRAVPRDDRADDADRLLQRVRRRYSPGSEFSIVSPWIAVAMPA